MTYLLIFFTSLITTIFLTPHLIAFLKKSNILDYPGERKIHTVVMPKMGGLIIFLIVLVMLNAFVEDFHAIKLLVISLSILTFSGIIDDVIGLNNFIKFILQNISAVILILFLEQYYTDVSLFGYIFQSPFDYLVMLLFIVGAVNSINFLDGLDGLASGFSILIFSVILALAITKNDPLLILLTVSLLGSTLGFLRFNAFPASVFLGDTGSLVLGFFLVVTSFLTSINFHESVLDLTFPLILLAVPLVDTVKVFIVRIIKKRDPFLGDTSHQHHILKRRIVSHEITVFIIELFSLVFIVLALLYLFDYKFESTILFFLFSTILVVMHRAIKKMNLIESIRNMFVKLHDFPVKNIFVLIKIFLIISLILMLIIVAFSFSTTTSLNMEELLYLLIMVMGLLSLVVFQKKDIKPIGNINVFLNFAIFFIISKLSLPYLFNEFLSFGSIFKVHEWAFILLTILISGALLLRWKALMTRNLFFTGTDLTIIVFIMLTFIVNNILSFDLNYYLSISLLEAFIFYIWYKLIIDLKKNYELGLTILSFILPLSIILTLIFSNRF